MRGQGILKRGCCLNNGLVLQIDRSMHAAIGRSSWLG